MDIREISLSFAKELPREWDSKYAVRILSTKKHSEK
jgi:hypothetical protein